MKLIPSPDSTEPEDRGYHHGNLRQTLVDTAVRLIEAHGVDQVSVRDVAKAAGVSPGAPFRHFPTRTALLTAVAEQAMDRLQWAVKTQLEQAAQEPPLRRYRAIGIGFLGWAIHNPVHFQIISARALIDFEGSALRVRNDQLRATMADLMRQAQADGVLRAGDPEAYAVMGRALAYGIARMYIDGQFPSWGLPEADAEAYGLKLFDQFLSSISKTQGGHEVLNE